MRKPSPRAVGLFSFLLTFGKKEASSYCSSSSQQYQRRKLHYCSFFWFGARTRPPTLRFANFPARDPPPNIMVTTRRQRHAFAAAAPPSSFSDSSNQEVTEVAKKAMTKKRRFSTTRSRTQRTAMSSISTAALPPETTGDPPRTAERSNEEDADPSSPTLLGDRGRTVLLTLDGLIPATLVARPSQRNRSPYVADVWVPSLEREALCHVPNLDMGGKCVPGAKLWIKPACDSRTGRPVGPNAVGGKYGTPKCEFIVQLLCVDESPYSLQYYPPTLVGAHPSLGERIARIWLERNLIVSLLPVANVQAQVTMGSSRFDFVVTHTDGSQRVVEVKTVVDADYSINAPPPVSSPLKCRYLSSTIPYERTAIFPWGTSKQKGPDGESVVSARAIHHIQQLTAMVQKHIPPSKNEPLYHATLLFVVVRGDVTRFRPNADACPSFVKHLQVARDAGVHIVAKRVHWGDTEDDIGVCYNSSSSSRQNDDDLPIVWPGDDKA